MRKYGPLVAAIKIPSAPGPIHKLPSFLNRARERPCVPDVPIALAVPVAGGIKMQPFSNDRPVTDAPALEGERARGTGAGGPESLRRRSRTAPFRFAGCRCRHPRSLGNGGNVFDCQPC